MSDAIRRLAVPVGSFLLAVSLQIGGYHNERVAWLLFGLAAASLGVAAVTWRPIGIQIGRVPFRVVRVGQRATPQRQAAVARSDGLLWRDARDWFQGMFALAHCPDHPSVVLLLRDNRDKSLLQQSYVHKSHSKIHNKGKEFTTLFCSHSNGHPVELNTTEEIADWDAAVAKATEVVRAMLAEQPEGGT